MFNILQSLKKRRDYNHTVRELSNLPADVALDLGIYPGDAAKIASGIVYGR